jgi:drug/metabolite transporter (DMT)-like permease
VTDPPAGPRGLVHQLGPVLTAATMFGVSDVSGKYVLESGSDVLTLLAFRSVVGLGLVFIWLRLGPPGAELPPRLKWISLGLGMLLTINLFGVFKAIELIPVSIAILTYFIYPLLTGLFGALTGIDRLSWRGAATAVIAFLGLGLIIGANPAHLAVLGLVTAVGGALVRVAMLLITARCSPTPTRGSSLGTPCGRRCWRSSACRSRPGTGSRRTTGSAGPRSSASASPAPRRSSPSTSRPSGSARFAPRST